MSEENKNLPKVEKVENNEEKGSKKRDIIKNVAIIFLAVMLLLTFFSNTIMNYSLPQVSTQSIESGTIKTQVRGKGTIELVDPYNVIMDETRTIASVRVKEGDEVQEGDVLYVLEGIESEELATAKKDLKTAETAYLTGLLDGSITMTTNSEDAAAIQKNLAALQSVIDARQADIDLHTNNVNTLTLQLKALGGTYKADTTQYSIDVINAQRAVDLAKANRDVYADLEKAYQAAVEARDNPGTDEQGQPLPPGPGPTPEQTEGHNKYVELDKKVTEANSVLATKKYNQDIAEANSSNDPNAAKKVEIQRQIDIETEGITLSKKALDDAQANKDKYVKEMTGQVKGSSAVDEINNLRDKVAKLEAKTMGSEIKSPVTGKVVTVSKQAGEKTEPKETVAVIQVEGKGLCTKISVETRQANKVKVGDPVMIEDYFYYGCTANLAAIQPDKDDPKNKRTLLFDLVGEDFQAGGTVSLAVGQANQSFNLVIPKSGLREDTKGKYILILESKAVPFGTRYIAKKVDVTQVYAEDDMNVAIEAAVEPWGTYVITNQTKPIKNGDQVRLATEESK